MNRCLLFLLFLTIFAVESFAVHVAVLETGADASAKEFVSLSDRQYLTNVLREQAVKELPATQNYVIMTRENIQQMLPPGKTIEDCEGSCLVETGKNIAADYICQAYVGSFGGTFTLSAELYETAGNKLIASFNGRGTDVNELLEIIKLESPEFFRTIREMNSSAPEQIPVVVEQMDTVPEQEQTNEPVAEPEPDSVQTVAAEPNHVDSVRVLAGVAYDELNGDDGWNDASVPTNTNAESKGSGIHKIPLAISAVATVTGVVLAVVGNYKAKLAHWEKYSTEAEYKKLHDDAKSGQTMRAIGIGVAIAGTVGIGISIVF